MKAHRILLLTTLAYHSSSLTTFSPTQLEPHRAVHSSSALNHPVHSQPQLVPATGLLGLVCCNHTNANTTSYLW